MSPAVRQRSAVTACSTAGWRADLVQQQGAAIGHFKLAALGRHRAGKGAALDRFASTVNVITQPCPGLVELIETGDLHSEDLRTLLRGYVEPLLAAGCDTIILGCTHYPFLKPLLSQMLSPSITLIDTGAAVARQLQRLLDERGLLAAGPARETQLWTSASPENLRNILPVLWNKSGVVRSFDL